MSTVTVSVVDQPDSFTMLREEEQFVMRSQRSLAVVLLPSSLSSLNGNLHTLFLPIVKAPSNDAEIFSTGALRSDAEKQWESFSIPSSQLLLWHVDGPSPVMSEHEITELDPSEFVLGFEPLLPRKRRLLKGIRDQIASSPAVTFLAILSIVLGYIVSMSSPLPIPAEKEAISAVVKILANTSHMTPSPIPVPSPSPVSYESVALARVPPSSLSTLAPTIELRPAAMLTPNTESLVRPRSSAPLKPTNDCTTPSYSLSLTTTKALSIFPPTVKSLSLPSSSTSAQALNTRLSSTLQDFFSANAVGKALYSDMKDLIDALDELLHVITSQASSALSLTFGAVDTLREHIHRGNRRARERARRIRSRGTQALHDAHGLAWARVELAQRRAKEIHARLNEEAAAVVERVQRSWDERVAERERRRVARKERRALRDRARANRRAARAAT